MASVAHNHVKKEKDQASAIFQEFEIAVKFYLASVEKTGMSSRRHTWPLVRIHMWHLRSLGGNFDEEIKRATEQEKHGSASRCDVAEEQRHTLPRSKDTNSAA